MFEAHKIIDRKRRSLALDERAIKDFVSGVSDGIVTDAQLGAFTMAVRFQGMNQLEQTALTLAMRDSGSVLAWEGLNGPVLDKHSTGGVGDLVSLVLVPMLASCGGYVPMISGRGLGHTGGTLDKLESIPGFSVHMDLDQLRKLLRRSGMAMVGQSADLAPADGRLYAVRDVTATVESKPLIVASILSKKLAEGLDGLVLDVKTGNGATFAEYERSLDLAKNLCTTSNRAGTPCTALITDMNQPLAWSAGNALEVREAIDFLAGSKRHPRLLMVTLELCSELLLLGGLAADANDARKQLLDVLDNGGAAEKFAQMVANQGGPADLVSQPDKYFPTAPFVRAVTAREEGWVHSMNTRSIGMAVVRLGGGRIQVDDTIDHRVGLADLCSVGDHVDAKQSICTIHAANEQDWQQAAKRVIGAVDIQPRERTALPTIYQRLPGEQTQS